MAINLNDLRSAVTTYLNSRVTTTVADFTPDVPSALSPNERFTFSLLVRNAPEPEGIALTNVRYHLRVTNPNVGRLITPSRLTTGTAYARADLTQPIAEGMEVSEYYLVPPRLSDASRLAAGERDVLRGLRGRALALGTFEIRTSVVAEADLDYLFPKQEDSRETLRHVTVV